MTTPLLRKGMTGPAVRDLQNALNQAMSPSPNLTADGVFGQKTETAVKKFQSERRIAADGVVGPITQCVLRGARRPAPVMHGVRLIAQPTPSTCWAAATAMMKNSTPAQIIAATPAHLVSGAGGTPNFSERADHVSGNQEFARAHGLRYHAPQSYMVSAFVSMVRSSPVMLSMLWDVGEYTAGRGSSGHRVVVYGIDSDGDATGAGTLLHIHDPWAPNVGKTYQRSYLRMVTDVPCFTYGVFTR